MSLNLLPNAAKFQNDKIKVKKRVGLIVIIILSLQVLLLLTVFVWNLIVKDFVTRNTKRYKESVAVYESLSNKLVLSYKLKQGIGILSGIFDTRFKYSDVFDKIDELFPPGVDLVSFELKGKKSFVLEGSTFGFESLDEIEDIIERIKEGKDKNFRSVNLSSLLVVDDRGGCNFYSKLC